MKIELKKIAFYERMSEETNAFTCDVYVNGIKTGYAKNDGQGGSTYIHSYEGKSLLLHEAESYAEAQPPIQVTFANHTHPIKVTLDLLIDKMVEEHVKAKLNKNFEKKIQKACEVSIVWGVPNSGSFHAIPFQGKPKLSEISKTMQGQAAIKTLVEKIKKQMKIKLKI